MWLIVSLLKSLVIISLSIAFFIFMIVKSDQIKLQNSIDFLSITNTWTFIEWTNKDPFIYNNITLYNKKVDVNCPWITDISSECYSSLQKGSIKCLKEIKECYNWQYNGKYFLKSK